MTENTKRCSYCGKHDKNGCRVNGDFYCNSCYQRMHKYGSAEPRKRKSTNKFEVVGDTLVITLKNGFKYYADAEELEKLQKYSWCKAATGYAVANIGHKVTKMHRYILGISDPQKLVDHKNRNISDNRKQNLRICTRAENCRNKSVSKNCETGHIGIRKTENNTFNVRITCNWKEIHVGNFKTLEEAIKARAKAENKYHKEFASHLT